VVHCKKVGRGLPALQYLSCYLYRGVINNNIINDNGSYVTFRYKDSGTTQWKRVDYGVGVYDFSIAAQLAQRL
jgi:hypothetical protein